MSTIILFLVSTYDLNEYKSMQTNQVKKLMTRYLASPGALELLMWHWWVRIPIEDLADEEDEEGEEDEKWRKSFCDKVLVSWNSQRSEKELWLVTFCLWRCLSICDPGRVQHPRPKNYSTMTKIYIFNIPFEDEEDWSELHILRSSMVSPTNPTQGTFPTKFSS